MKNYNCSNCDKFSTCSIINILKTNNAAMLFIDINRLICDEHPIAKNKIEALNCGHQTFKENIKGLRNTLNTISYDLQDAASDLDQLID